MVNAVYLATFGLALSCYAVYVEYRHSLEAEGEHDPFVALCDIEQIGASCSAVFAMPEGKLMSYFGIVPEEHALDVPNAVLGILYYSLILTNEIILAEINISIPPVFIKIASATAMSSSIYLAIVLSKLKELCILCWTTHIINTLLLYTIFKRKSNK